MKCVRESCFNVEGSSTYTIIIRIQSFSILSSIYTQASCIGRLALPTQWQKIAISSTNLASCSLVTPRKRTLSSKALTKALELVLIGSHGQGFGMVSLARAVSHVHLCCQGVSQLIRSHKGRHGAVVFLKGRDEAY